MFYSRLLLARKAPLGQIWMAATMHAKLNRKKLSKLNIIKICEEILNPSVPMALRLSGILMGGVVIVYQRKVKLLYDDVNRLLMELNEAWKVKAVTLDPTLHPKNKAQAKYESVTLPENPEDDFGPIEHQIRHSNTINMMDFQHTSYAAVSLDNVENPYININLEEDPSHDFHQVDADNITLFDRFDSYREDTDLNNHFERFDIEADEETLRNLADHDNTQIPDTLIPSPPKHCRHEQQNVLAADEILEQYPEELVNQKSNEGKGDIQPTDHIRPVPPRRRARKPRAFTMDNDQIIIPGHIYQTWLQNCSDIVSRRGRKRKKLDAFSTMKVARLMELPPLVLIERLLTKWSREVHYPKPLLNLWMKSTQPPHDSPSGRNSGIQPPEPSSSSPLERNPFPDLSGNPFEDFQSGVDPQIIASREKQVDDFNEIPDNFEKDLRNNVPNIDTQLSGARGVSKTTVNDPMATPGGSGYGIRSIPSSESGHGFPSSNSDLNLGRSNRKRPYSSSRHSSSSLEPVAENGPEVNLKMKRLSELSETGFTPDLIETGPTQTQNPTVAQPCDKITDSIRMQLKTHFNTPGSPEVECLNDLTIGMSRKQAACMFYHTCVFATEEFIRVKQETPYGGIFISRGAKM
ncbi:sister chromatid cohesion 1 protein 1 [Ipomoea triloba]|uniref:sister chromatid cohesion 1 protein 1 n=1 Tax=Ipomoea triloba TaxID=35885 RepID=UPI00125D6C87|nr:sister chromatid cohesion 1 protein 1 [Ipomoea triloba]